MKVSVLITTYNLEQYIEETLDSVMMQETNFPYEVLIGDDGSDDGTMEILKRYRDRYPEQLKIFVMPRDPGRQYNRVERSADNRRNLLKEAKGEYCTFLDGDDYYLTHDRLQRMADVLDRKENADCIMCSHNLKIVYADKREMPLCRAKTERKFSLKQYWKWMFLQANAVMFRNIYKEHPPKELCARYFDDNNITYWLFQYGKMYYLPECMGAYRQVEGSSWNAIDHLKQSASNMIGYSVEMEENPKGRRLSDIRHFPDYAYLFKHKKEIDRNSCAPFYETAEKHQINEALRVYHMSDSKGMQYLRFCLRYVTGMLGYKAARLERILLKIAGKY